MFCKKNISCSFRGKTPLLSQTKSMLDPSDLSWWYGWMVLFVCTSAKALKSFGQVRRAKMTSHVRGFADNVIVYRSCRTTPSSCQFRESSGTSS